MKNNIKKASVKFCEDLSLMQIFVFAANHHLNVTSSLLRTVLAEIALTRLHIRFLCNICCAHL